MSRSRSRVNKQMQPDTACALRQRVCSSAPGRKALHFCAADGVRAVGGRAGDPEAAADRARQLPGALGCRLCAGDWVYHRYSLPHNQFAMSGKSLRAQTTGPHTERESAQFGADASDQPQPYHMHATMLPCQ